ncbi:MAG: site-2 protease family protein, partial [Allosphingosinicella sp.]
MSWSISLGSVRGTAVRLHVTFVLFLLWIGIALYLQGGWAAAIGGVTFLLCLFLCVLLHEFGHILAARHFGVRTPEVVLLPIGGMARLERIPERPREELLMALAGPAVTLAIALLLVLLLGGLPEPAQLFAPPGVRNLLAQLAFANLSLLVFNLIPAFPLDGGRVLRALLAMRLGHVRATMIAAAVGRAAAIVFAIFGLMAGHVLLVVIAFFIYIVAGAESGLAQLRGITSIVPARELMITSFE